MLTVEFTLAIAGRAAPQLQILLIGFPVKILVGLWLITASLYFLPNALRHVLSAIQTNLTRVMELLS
jgi:flagellar biosynthetic protein FliR